MVIELTGPLAPTSPARPVDVRPRQDRAATWLAPERGIWVATRGGEHAGRVERVDGDYLALDGRGHPLGHFDELDQAMSAVDGGVAADPEVARRRWSSAFVALSAAAAGAAATLAIALVR